MRGVGRPVRSDRAVQRLVVPHRSGGQPGRQHHAARHPRGPRLHALERRQGASCVLCRVLSAL